MTDNIISILNTPQSEQKPEDSLQIIRKDDEGYYYTSFDTFKELYTTDLIGARTKCTPEMSQMVADLILKGLSIQDAADAVGVTRMALWNWKDRGRREIERLAEASERGEKLEFLPGEDVFVYFYELVSRAVPMRKLRLLGKIEDDGKGQWQSSSWLLERLHPEDYARKTKVEVYDWRMEVIELIRDGVFTFPQLLEELNDRTETEELFKRAGIPVLDAGEISEDS